MKIVIPSVSIDSTPAEIAKVVQNSPNGILIVTDLPPAPFSELRATFDFLSENEAVTDRLNRAYTKNQVYKDAFAHSKGGPTVDMKRVLDLSPERLLQIQANDPALAEEIYQQQGSFRDTMTYWDRLRNGVAPKLEDAVSRAIGRPGILEQDAAYNYRMVDYYERASSNEVPPRCGEHRDFGSFTLSKSRGCS